MDNISSNYGSYDPYQLNIPPKQQEKSDALTRFEDEFKAIQSSSLAPHEKWDRLVQLMSKLEEEMHKLSDSDVNPKEVANLYHFLSKVQTEHDKTIKEEIERPHSTQPQRPFGMR